VTGGETIVLPFHVRTLLALEALRARAERRDGLVSDDDVLDTAQQWSIARFDDPEDVADDIRNGGWRDFELLAELLFNALEPEDER